MSTFWTDAYRAHFQHYFQKPFDIQTYRDRKDEGLALKIATYDWARRGFRVYASMGLADKLLANDEDQFGEVILFSDVPDKEVPALFVNALFFILHKNIPLGSRFSIGGIDQMRPDFAARSRKSALYFTLAADEEDSLNKVRHAEDFGRVYQAYFISAEEDEYLELHGPDAFEKLWHRQLAEDLSLRRPSFISEDLQPIEERLRQGEPEAPIDTNIRDKSYDVKRKVERNSFRS
jgi:hypothetical protein